MSHLLHPSKRRDPRFASGVRKVLPLARGVHLPGHMQTTTTETAVRKFRGPLGRDRIYLLDAVTGEDLGSYDVRIPSGGAA